MQRSAGSALTQKIHFLSKPSIPNPTINIYLHFEDDPTQYFIYLCGLTDPESALRDLNYHGLFCTDQAGEAKIWKEFQTICEALSTEDYVVFHFSSYEKTKLTVLERKYGVSSTGTLELFKSRMVDLHPIVKKSVTLPARGYGLRNSPLRGIEISAANAGGAQSIVWFQKYQQDPSDVEVMSILLQYNREDCLAMKFVEEWLRKLC